MLNLRTTPGTSRGITVLGLLLVIIALIIAAIFLVRYLRSRPAVSWAPPPALTSSAA